MAAVSTQVGALTNEESVRNYILYDYDKGHHPDNRVTLTYSIVYVACPIPDQETGTLVSEVNEIQVSLGIYTAFQTIIKGTPSF